MTSPENNFSYTPQLLSIFKDAVDRVAQLVKAIRIEFESLCAAVDDLVRKAEQHLEDHWIKRIIDFIFNDISEALDKIRIQIEKVKALISALLKKAEEALDGAVPVFSLFAVSFELPEKVRQPLTGLPGNMTGSGEIDFWRGPTKDTYEKRVQDQQQAVAAASAKVAALGDYLVNAATANMTYMSLLMERALEVYQLTVQATIDTLMTSVGAVTQLPFVLSDFSDAIATAHTNILQQAVDLGNRVVEILGQIQSLEMAKSDLTGLTEHGGWPSPVAT